MEREIEIGPLRIVEKDECLYFYPTSQNTGWWCMLTEKGVEELFSWLDKK